MLQADQRGPSGAKRSRTDGPQSPGDWACPKCGNVNFAFRTTCNMRKCGTSKPTEPSPRGPGGHVMHSGYDQVLGPMYVGGAGGPPAMPLGYQSNYGSAMTMASAGVPYDYGANAYTVPYGPPAAGGFGAPPLMDGYSVGIGRGHLISGLRPQVYAENGRKRRGGPDGMSDGDWICPKCDNKNFAFRTICNMRTCSTPKPTEQVSRFGNGQTRGSAQGSPPEGSWTCQACDNVNYPFRNKCNRRNCGAEKPGTEDPPKDTNPSEQ